MEPPAAPSWTEYQTAVFVVPVTLAVKVAAPPVATLAVAGASVIATVDEEVTVTVAVAVLEVSATLRATTW
jgi:hypothetical protein